MMMQTIVTSSHISVQGEVVKRLANGMVIVRVGSSEYIGRPVAAVQKIESPVRKREVA